jgi:hypothetical protein
MVKGRSYALQLKIGKRMTPTPNRYLWLQTIVRVRVALVRWARKWNPAFRMTDAAAEKSIALSYIDLSSDAVILRRTMTSLLSRRVQKGIMCALMFLLFAGLAQAETPRMPIVVSTPPSGEPPLSSAARATDPGTEYVDLKKAGYVEEEYYLSGVAPAITAKGEALFDAPYITRILVRKPKDPDKFNGTVVIEPFSWFGERAAGWILTKEYLVRKGYAFVGYTLNINKPADDPKFPPGEYDEPNRYAAIVNFDFMRRFDYARYATLGVYYDPARFRRGGAPDPFVPQSQGIGAQLALLLKSNAPDGPMADLMVDRVYVNSWAVTAQVWMDYLDQGRHQQWRMPDGAPLIDAYMTGKMSFGEVGGDVIRVPRNMPDDAPFVTIYTESELMHDALEGVALPPDTDHPKLRYYEVTGTSHLRLADFGTQETEPTAADIGKADDPLCQQPQDEPAQYVMSALLDDMDRWVRNGEAMPKAPRVKRNSIGVERDPETGNMIGGVRPPWIKVPAATYLTAQETGCGFIFDTKILYTAAKLQSLYGDYDDYRRKFEAAKIDAIEEGYLLPEDGAHLVPIAGPEDFRTPAE